MEASEQMRARERDRRVGDEGQDQEQADRDQHGRRDEAVAHDLFPTRIRVVCAPHDVERILQRAEEAGGAEHEDRPTDGLRDDVLARLVKARIDQLTDRLRGGFAGFVSDLRQESVFRARMAARTAHLEDAADDGDQNDQQRRERKDRRVGDRSGQPLRLVLVEGLPRRTKEPHRNRRIPGER